ncbi:SDR family oxidoreductase [Agromyces seonyuensis]|uniref:NAD-dependent epimerase/dehydratase family protein n=1 Tax=Agromyces seonyuensis TaxID=2662446 RepID=A0A6I4P3F8_9MICO|nr:SDR family oxidoreductase [Agromyces seonyuensis]MWB98719.1 NAD-dependent epimerase/dehydratase family protein [Agromyces seonyuensis]
MRIFVTGASGWIGSASIAELLAAGHEIVGLARSEASAARIEGAGGRAVRGALADLDLLAEQAAAADGVLHLGFNHDFSDYAGAGRTERAVVETFGDALAGSGKPFAFASGVAGFALGRPVTEADASAYRTPDAPRGGVEPLALGFADRGIRSMALRFAPTVHGAGDHGFTNVLVETAHRHGVAAFIGDGANRWPAVHRLDAAKLVALAVETAPAGTRVHAVAESGVPTREIAAAIGRSLGVPTVSIDPADAAEHFGWLGALYGADLPASSEATRELLGWAPVHPTLVEDLDGGAYRSA